MVKFRQKIRPGQSGRDVRAVKRTMIRMGTQGSASLSKNNKAGPQFVHCIKAFQSNHKLKITGVYNEATHNLIAPHFKAYDVFLYKTAAIRKPPTVNVLDLNAQDAAKKLLQFHSEGKWIANNPGDLYDVQRTAQGLPVWSPLGYWVHIEKRPLEAIIFIIQKGYKIGTFAICSDHHTIDGRHGHNGGHAIDIDEINGVQISSQSTASHNNTLAVAKLLRSGMPSGLTPWQLICNGYGYMYSSDIAAQTIGYYGYSTLVAHRNHIHLGYYGD